MIWRKADRFRNRELPRPVAHAGNGFGPVVSARFWAICCQRYYYQKVEKETPMTLKTKTGHDSRKWLDRVIPLPKEVEISGSVRLRADQIGLSCSPEASPPVSTATTLLRSFDFAAEKEAPFTIGLVLLADAGTEVDQDVRNRLPTLPNREQAYAILPLSDKNGLTLVANTPQGLLYAARTLEQLVRVSGQVRPETEIEVPLVRVVDWPDLSERGQWGGNTARDLTWTSRWKLNVLEVSAQATVDEAGNPVALVSRDLFRQGAELGVKVVPYIPHLEQMLNIAGMMDKKGFANTPDPSKPLPSDYVPGLCMSNLATLELVEAWLARTAEIEGVTDIQVWLSEDAAPCYCPKCIGKEPFGLEVVGIVGSFNKVKVSHPRARLHILTTQGSYPVNDEILAALPEDVGVTYYDGGRTYDSSHEPMIYPLLEEYARSGRWLGVYPQITHAWRTVFPWTAPQFVQYRAQEFVEKKLRCMIGYAVPSNRYHEFSVMAMAEWTWNAQGRSPEAFARAFATITGMPDPDLFARWALKAGAAGWVLAESRLLLHLIYDPSLGLKGDAPFGHRFQNAGILDVGTLNETITTAREGLKLALEACDPDRIDESECVLAGLEAFEALRFISGSIRASSLDAQGGKALAESFDRLDRCAYILRTRTLDWGERVCAGTDEKLPSRLLDTACVLLRTCDAVRERTANLGVPDPSPATRLRKLGEWSAQDFAHGRKAILILDLEGIVPDEGGSYHVGFDFIDSACGTDIERIAIRIKHPEHSSTTVIAQTPDELKRLSVWERWCEMRIRIPSTPPGAKLTLELALSGLPPDAPEGRRTCSGSVGIRRVRERGCSLRKRRREITR